MSRQVGGYTLPFVSLGCVLFITAILTFLLLPKHDDHSCKDSKGGKGTRHVMSSPHRPSRHITGIDCFETRMLRY